MSFNELLDERFMEIWPNWLELMVLRTKIINETIGNPVDAIIIQIVCWHHLLSSTSDQSDANTSFSEAFQAWHSLLDESELPESSKKKKLTIAAISFLTAIPFETVRRRIKALCENGWLEASTEFGVIYNPTEENNLKIVEKIHQHERKLLRPFLKKALVIFE